MRSVAKQDMAFSTHPVRFSLLMAFTTQLIFITWSSWFESDVHILSVQWNDHASHKHNGSDLGGGISDDYPHEYPGSFSILEEV